MCKRNSTDLKKKKRKKKKEKKKHGICKRNFPQKIKQSWDV